MYDMLGSKQIEWILDFLSGSGPMGKLLLRRKDGFLFSEAKSYPAQAIVSDFRWGLICEDACSEAFSIFAADVKLKLDSRNVVCLFRECDFHKSDPCMKNESCSMVYVGYDIIDDIMYLLDESSNEEEIGRTIRRANKFMLMCEIRGGGQTPRRGDEITYEVFENLLDHLVGVAIGICDDMGICYIPYDAGLSKGDVNNNAPSEL